MMKSIVIGPELNDLSEALAASGDCSRLEGTASREQLLDAGIEAAALLVITDVGLATAIPIARELNSDLRIVVYAAESLPEFARPGTDLILDPDLIDPQAVAEELL